MAHIYMTFDFGTDEGKAQSARHKLDGWKQAFRLDKKLLYKFERPADGAASDDAKPPEVAPAKKEEAKAAKGAKSGKTPKGKAKAEPEKEEKTPAPSGPVKLHLRLAFPGHEKMTEDRLLKRIAGEEPFKEVTPKTTKPSDAGFGEFEAKFESLE